MRSSRPRPGLALAAAVLIALAVKFFAIDAAIVDGRSMLPFLVPGSVVLVLRCAYGLRLPSGETYLLRWASPRVGDLVAAESPRDGKPVVKRVAAIGVEGGFVLLGDNPPESIDSRDYGPVPLGAIRGEVFTLGFRRHP
jgi:signal peptidase I